MSSEVDRRIKQASKAFGSLRKAVFADRDLSLKTKRKIYLACVLSILLYGAECWTLLRRDKKKLISFHHRCIRTILGITNRQQWKHHHSDRDGGSTPTGMARTPGTDECHLDSTEVSLWLATSVMP